MIIIVVMLVIAGGVAAVLFTRGGEAIDSLEAQSVGAVTETNCPTTSLTNDQGLSISGMVDTTATPRICNWAGAVGRSLSVGSQNICRSFGGTPMTASGTGRTLNLCAGVSI